MAILKEIFTAPATRPVEAFSKEDVKRVFGSLQGWFSKHARNVKISTKFKIMGDKVQVKFDFLAEEDLASQFFKDGEVVITPTFTGGNAKVFLHYHTGGTVYIGKFEIQRNKAGEWDLVKSNDKDTM